MCWSKAWLIDWFADGPGVHARSSHGGRTEGREVSSARWERFRGIHRAGETNVPPAAPWSHMVDVRVWCGHILLTNPLSLSLHQIPDKKIVMMWRYNNWPSGTFCLLLWHKILFHLKSNLINSPWDGTSEQLRGCCETVERVKVSRSCRSHTSRWGWCAIS